MDESDVDLKEILQRDSLNERLIPSMESKLLLLMKLLMLETITFEEKNLVRKAISMLRMIQDFHHGFY